MVRDAEYRLMCFCSKIHRGILKPSDPEFLESLIGRIVECSEKDRTLHVRSVKGPIWEDFNKMDDAIGFLFDIVELYNHKILEAVFNESKGPYDTNHLHIWID